MARYKNRINFATLPKKHLAVGTALALSALTLAGCSMPSAKSAQQSDSGSKTQISQTQKSVGSRVVYGKNQRLVASACQNFSLNAPSTTGVMSRCATQAQPAHTANANAQLDPSLLGFAPVDRHDAEDFSLEIARSQANEKSSPLAFGMLSGTFGQSWNYDLRMGKRTASIKAVDAGL